MALSGELLREARESAGLTQAELAELLETNQSSVARLESPRSNPRLSTLQRALAATGNQLELRLRPATYPSVDESMIRASLSRTPAERLATFTGAYRSLRRLAPTVRS
jgi:transcriptional regulator with XRE-family HTH domain